MTAQVQTFPKAFGIWFNETERWDVKFFSSRLESKYPFVPLGDFIREHNEKVNLFEFPDESFDILGVNNINGVFFAYSIFGKKIHQPYKRVNAGDFTYNPYRVNIGSIGIIPKNLGNKFISPAYVVFSVDENKIVPKLLELILKSKWFNPKLRAATAGSVRQNLTFELLKTLEIPLPPIDIQKEIIFAWQQAQVKAAKAQERVEELKQEIEASFYIDLGLKPPKKTSRLKTFAVWWKDFERWSVSYSQAVQSGTDITHGKYPIRELGSLLEFVQYGTSEKANTKENGTPVLRINNIKNGILDLSDLKHIPLAKKTLDGLLLKDGDILVIRTNGSRDLVGTCAVFHEKEDYIFASYLIRLRFNSQKVNPYFVSHFLNSELGREQVNAISRQIMQNNINSEELRSLQIPLPPLNIQEEIMRRVEEGRSKIRQEQEAAAKIKEESEREIERMILGLSKA